jgi:hypothetical protein
VGTCHQVRLKVQHGPREAARTDRVARAVRRVGVQLARQRDNQFPSGMLHDAPPTRTLYLQSILPDEARQIRLYLTPTLVCFGSVLLLAARVQPLARGLDHTHFTPAWGSAWLASDGSRL